MAKARIPRFYAAVHLGICHSVDRIKAIYFGEKAGWRGEAASNQTLEIDRKSLHGGIREEGGVAGKVDVMMGRPDQVPTQALADRLDTGTPQETPGFRGILSLLFRDGPDSEGGFYFQAASPYLKPVWVHVQRIPRQLNAVTAEIARGSAVGRTSLYFELQHTTFDTLQSVVYQKSGMVNAQMEVMTYGMNQVLDVIEGALDVEWELDMGIAAYPSGQKVERKGVTLDDIADFRALVNSLNNDGDKNHVWADSIQPAVDWFTESAADVSIIKRLNVFLTCGLPHYEEEYDPNNPTQHEMGHLSPEYAAAVTEPRSRTREAERAAEVASDLLDGTIPVQMHGVICDGGSSWTHLEYIEHLINVPNAPIIGGVNVEGLVELIATPAGGAGIDANPAHVIFECLTDTDWGMGEDPARINTASFEAAAQTLLNEDFGVFLQWQAAVTIEEFVNEVLDHIHGALFADPGSGQWRLRLMRDDLDYGGLPVVDPDNAQLVSFSRKGWGETINEVVVTWTNPITEKEETLRAQDLANIAQQGAVVSDSRNYYGVRTAALAQRLAERELRSSSAPLSSCEVIVGREFWDLTPFEGVRVTWPEFGLHELPMRVMQINYGSSDKPEIRLSLLEDVFSLSVASFVAPVGSAWLNPSVAPQVALYGAVLNAPAHMVLDSSFTLGEVVAPRTVLSLLALNATDDPGATYDVAVLEPDGSWSELGVSRSFVGRATLAGALPVQVTSTVALDAVQGGSPTVGDIVLLGFERHSGSIPANVVNTLITGGPELAVVTAFDSATGAVTLRRGVLDTIPRAWPAGAAVWFAAAEDWEPLPRIFEEDGTDDTLEERESDVTVKLLVQTSGGRLETDESSAFVARPLTRASRPLRPAKLKLNGEDIATEVDLQAETVLTYTWAHRNRLTEIGTIHAWGDPSVTPEPGTTYRVELDAYTSDGTLIEAAWYVEDVGVTDTHTVDLAVDEPPAGAVLIDGRVVAVRDGEDSWQAATIRARRFIEPHDLMAQWFTD